MTLRDRIDALGGDYEWQQRLRDHVFVLVTDAIRMGAEKAAFEWYSNSSASCAEAVRECRFVEQVMEAQTDE